MVAYKILEVGSFMNLLLSNKNFDLFSVGGITVRTITDFTADGKRNKDWCCDEDENDSEYLSWQEIKGFVYERVKGKKKPGLLKVEMLVDREDFFKVFLDFKGEAEDFSRCSIKTFRLNFKYESLFGQPELLTVTTGVSYSDFTMDKSWEQYWDEKAAGFLKGMGLTLEKM